MKGQSTTVPRKGITVYEIIWDTSSLPHLVINESQLQRTILREDKEMVSRLKRARALFDEVYPDGPTKGFLSVRKPRNKRKVGQKSSGVSQQSTIPDNDASNQGPSITSRHLTNLRLAPVLRNADQPTNNATIDRDRDNE